MNNNDRKDVGAVLSHLAQCKEIITRLSNSEHQKLDNMPEAFQFSDKPDQFNHAIGELELAMMGLKICETHLKTLCPTKLQLNSSLNIQSKLVKNKWEKFMMKSLTKN